MCLSFSEVNYTEQRRFQRFTRQRNTLQANNVDNCYNSRDNSYTHPSRGNHIYPIATSTITIDCSQFRSTKQCSDRSWWKWPYYSWMCTTDGNPTRSHQMTICPSTGSQCMIKAYVQRRDFLRTNSAYHVDQYPPRYLRMLPRGRCFTSIDTTKVNPSRANTIFANSVRNTYNAKNTDALHPTPSSDSEVLPVVNNNQATRKQANLQLILRNYVVLRPISLSQWPSGVPMSSTEGPLIPRQVTSSRGYLSHLLWGDAMFIDHPLWGKAMLINHLCTDEVDTCNLNLQRLRFQLRTSCS